MSGVYGTIKPADIDIDNDVVIFYHYRPSYNSDDANFKNFKMSGVLLIPIPQRAMRLSAILLKNCLQSIKKTSDIFYFISIKLLFILSPVDK